MKPYTAILSARFRVLVQYRAAAIAGVGTQIFWGLIRTMIFQAFYRASPHQPIDSAEIVTYLWLGQAMLLLLPWNVDTEIRAMMRSGTVAYELLRPVDLYSSWYMRAIAHRTAPTLLRCVPMFVLAGLFFGLKPPPTLYAAGAWIVTTAGSLALGCAVSTLMNITVVSTLSGEGISRFFPSLVLAGSGMLVPLALLPRWAAWIMAAQPFCGLVDTPFVAYLGHLPPKALALALLHQLVWTVVFVVFGRVLLARATRRMVVQGG